MLRNPLTGEELTVVRDEPELLVLESVWPRAGHRAAPHVHPEIEERFVVLEGVARLRVGDEPERDLRPGDALAVPPGAPHLAWNPTDERVRLHLEFRPPLGWLRFVERLCAGDDGVTLLRDFPREVAPAPPGWPG